MLPPKVNVIPNPGTCIPRAGLSIPGKGIPKRSGLTSRQSIPRMGIYRRGVPCPGTSLTHQEWAFLRASYFREQKHFTMGRVPSRVLIASMTRFTHKLRHLTARDMFLWPSNLIHGLELGLFGILATERLPVASIPASRIGEGFPGWATLPRDKKTWWAFPPGYVYYWWAHFQWEGKGSIC